MRLNKQVQYEWPKDKEGEICRSSPDQDLEYESRRSLYLFFNYHQKLYCGIWIRSSSPALCESAFLGTPFWISCIGIKVTAVCESHPYSYFCQEKLIKSSHPKGIDWAS